MIEQVKQRATKLIFQRNYKAGKISLLKIKHSIFIFLILNSNSPVKMLQVLKNSFYFELERDYAIQEMLKITI